MAGKDAAALGKMDPELAAVSLLSGICRVQEADSAFKLLKTIPVVPRIETDDIPTSSRMLSETPPADGSPLIIFSRGGGFCLDGLESEEMSCRLFADEFGAANLAPTYLQVRRKMLFENSRMVTNTDDCDRYVEWTPYMMKPSCSNVDSDRTERRQRLTSSRITSGLPFRP